MMFIWAQRNRERPRSLRSFSGAVFNMKGSVTMDMAREYRETVEDPKFTVRLGGHSYVLAGLPEDYEDPSSWAELAGTQAGKVSSSTPTVKGSMEGKVFQGKGKGKHKGKDVRRTIRRFFGLEVPDPIKDPIVVPDPIKDRIENGHVLNGQQVGV